MWSTRSLTTFQRRLLLSSSSGSIQGNEFAYNDYMFIDNDNVDGINLLIALTFAECHFSQTWKLLCHNENMSQSSKFPMNSFQLLVTGMNNNYASKTHLLSTHPCYGSSHNSFFLLLLLIFAMLKLSATKRRWFTFLHSGTADCILFWWGEGYYLTVNRYDLRFSQR